MLAAAGVDALVALVVSLGLFNFRSRLGIFLKPHRSVSGDL